MRELKGLATGIGSLPYKNADAALDLIFKYAPHIPFWPQLPKRDIREGMIVQFSEGLPCLILTRNDLIFSSLEKEKELEKFYEKIIAGDRDYFKISQDYAAGLYAFHQKLLDKQDLLKEIEFIKCQVTGPFTLAASIKDEKQIALLHDPVFMQVIIKGLAMKALWQIKFFKDFRKKIIIFIDEPYLGCFGSGYTPINREDVVRGLRELTENIKSEEILIGIHCCGNTDWSIFTDIETIDIINFDAFSFLDKFILYTDNLKDFIKRKGIICWGIVPTQEFSDKETSELLIDRLTQGINALVKKGADKNSLLENLILSPSCGLGALDTEKSEKIFKLLSETSKKLQK